MTNGAQKSKPRKEKSASVRVDGLGVLRGLTGDGFPLEIAWDAKVPPAGSRATAMVASKFGFFDQ